MPVETIEYKGKRPMVRLMRILRKKKDDEWIPAKAVAHIVRKKIKDPRYKEIHWELLGNGNTGKQKLQNPDIELEPYSFTVFWNNFIAGEFFINGGWFAFNEDGANIEDFFNALKDSKNETA